MLVGELIEEGETDEAVAVMVAMDEGLAMEARTIVIAAMEGEVMEGGLDATVAEGAHEAGAELKAGADEIVHVAVIGGVVGNIGELNSVGFHLATKDAIVNLPDADTALLEGEATDAELLDVQTMLTVREGKNNAQLIPEGVSIEIQ